MRWVNELNSGSGEFVSKAVETVHEELLTGEQVVKHTSSIVELGGDADTRPVLRREGEVGLAHVARCLVRRKVSKRDVSG